MLSHLSQLIMSIKSEIEEYLSPPARLALALTSKSSLVSYEELNASNIFWKKSLEKVLSDMSGNNIELNYVDNNWRSRYVRFMKVRFGNLVSENAYTTLLLLFTTDILDSDIAISSGFFNDGDKDNNILYSIEIACINLKVDVLKFILTKIDLTDEHLLSGLSAEVVTSGNVDTFRLLYPLLGDRYDLINTLLKLVQKEDTQTIEVLYPLIENDVESIDIYLCAITAYIINNKALKVYFKSLLSDDESFNREAHYISMASKGNCIYHDEYINLSIYFAYVANGYPELTESVARILDLEPRDESITYIAIALERGYDVGDTMYKIELENILSEIMYLGFSRALDYVLENNLREDIVNAFSKMDLSWTLRKDINDKIQPYI